MEDEQDLPLSADARRALRDYTATLPRTLAAFPVQDSSGVISCRRKAHGASALDSGISSLKAASVLLKDTVEQDQFWETLSDATSYDEAALRNFVNKLKQSNQILQSLVEGKVTSLEERMSLMWKLAKLNQGFFTQITSVEAAIESFMKANEASSKLIGDLESGVELESVRSGRGSIASKKVQGIKALSALKSEVIRFDVSKSSVFGKKTTSVFEVDVTAETLTISKQDAEGEETILIPQTISSCTLSPDKLDEIKLDYFRSQDKLLRNLKTFKGSFASTAERERFYRILNTHFLSKSKSQTVYNPEPLKITNPETRTLFKSLKFPISEVSAQLHRAWTLQKLEQGWSYGPSLDDGQKTNPLLVPFEQLPADEQTRNNQMVSVTLESIYSLGFEITPAIKSETKGPAEVSGELLQLVEFLAENAHDIWASRKMTEGWKFGSVRDNDKKLHPLLIPYCDLLEKDKESDRDAAHNILGTLLQLGYQIQKPAPSCTGATEKSKRGWFGF